MHQFLTDVKICHLTVFPISWLMLMKSIKTYKRWWLNGFSTINENMSIGVATKVVKYYSCVYIVVQLMKVAPENFEI